MDNLWEKFGEWLDENGVSWKTALTINKYTLPSYMSSEPTMSLTFTASSDTIGKIMDFLVAGWAREKRKELKNDLRRLRKNTRY